MAPAAVAVTWRPGSGRLRAVDPVGRGGVGLLAAAGRNAARAADLLEETIRLWPESRSVLPKIRHCEHEGDRITRDLLRVLPRLGTSSIQRHEAHALAIAIDDVVDYVEEAADHLQLYQIEAPMEQAQALATTLREAAHVLARGLECLAWPEDLLATAEQLHRLERDGDRLVREAIAALFAYGVDPLFVVRWKDVYERLENAIDACDAAGHLLTGIALAAMPRPTR